MYDHGCYELAASFLLDSTCPKGEEFKKHAAELAQVIQDAIEDHISEKGLDDPTPWCDTCGAKRKTDCHCGPRADND
jgi:hypothetical protein